MAKKAPQKASGDGKAAPPRFGKGQPLHFCGKPGRSGPKPGNVNGLKNGSRLRVKRLTVGELPKPLQSVKREGRAYRRALEDEVLRVKGDVSLTDAHLVDTASAATIQAGICRWLLRNKIGQMKPSDILACSAAMTKAKQARDKAVAALDLDAPPAAPWIDVPATEEGQPDD